MILLALALAAAPHDDLMKNWAKCMSDYSQPRLLEQPLEPLVDSALAVCTKEEAAVRQSYIRQYGPSGAEVFVGVRHGVRKIMIKRLGEVKAMYGL